MIKKQTIRESKIENTVNKYAEKLGWMQKKGTDPAQVGWPDREYLRDGYTFFIEFKTINGKCSEIQKYMHEKIRNNGFEVYVVNSIELGIKILDQYEKTRFV